jgi:formylglycine-generating enzyme required for sulfatase activity
MMSNNWEWMESACNDTNYGADSSRGLRGSNWQMDCNCMQASQRNGTYPMYEVDDLGFRVASVPEPRSIALLVCGAIAGLLWWRRP